MSELGPIGRLGGWTARHFKAVVLAWVAIAIGFGFFAPRAEHALSGAGWEATGSESVQARTLVQELFGGQSSFALMAVVHGPGDLEPAIGRATAILEADPRVTRVAPASFSRDGRTAILQAGAARNPNEIWFAPQTTSRPGSR